MLSGANLIGIIAGAALISVGAWMSYRPVAYILAGALLIAILLIRSAKER